MDRERRQFKSLHNGSAQSKVHSVFTKEIINRYYNLKLSAKELRALEVLKKSTGTTGLLSEVYPSASKP